MIVEGQTEETFVRDVLAEHLASFQVYANARRVETGRRRAARGGGGGRRIYRGGMTTYQKARNDILRWLKQEERSPGTYVTTMFDLYALPEDFPEFQHASAKPTPELRVRALEDALREDIGFARFIPYIQLHEFEAMVLADPKMIAPQVERKQTDPGIRQLVALAEATPPEEIDDGEQTSPSKRIIGLFPEYAGRKSSAGPMIVMAIGLPQVRHRCPHLDYWVTQLEALGTRDGREPASS
jgi:hypothetical protein